MADQSRTHEYLGVAGVAGFARAAGAVCMGSSYQPDTMASIQTVAGTGACHLAATFLSRFYSFPTSNKTIYVATPSWGNYRALFVMAGLTMTAFQHLSEEGEFGIANYIDALQQAPPGSVFLLQSCGHNPTGMDPSASEWKVLSEVFRSRGHYVFFDGAYLGMASSSLEQDRRCVRSRYILACS